MESIFNSWPLATAISIIVALFVFREPLAELIGRIRAFKVAGHSVDASADLSKATSEQQEKVEPPTARATIPATHALPPPSDVYAPFEQHIRNGMAALNLPADVEKAWLIRLLAQWQVARGHEVTYRLITGSQIDLLLQANTAAPPNMANARETYDAAKVAYPDFYKAFAFETWVRFPVHSGLMREEASVLRITPLGQDFLHYLVNNSLTNRKYG